ncbi:non-canonical purine NTP pyrophosphatase [Vagococcus carniphilus]|uniref:Non-canonical purine NTP pyrophosphatase n=1 Tax=Vagococcus carniphilus TaxID=218144 RepID=A0AAW8U3T6_9ENTE|nr:non-canonical purine NTP pyrophosphatase [Vagococcus carniphilus]MDT2829362.1 non-canonical purine NTP pyrophosphatase [Vagococcus carniphilus]MDT2833431.1 non-canonical purine NTP pyrophosphatase [Vagococcus carniphilus]MDT2838821.1 non-canonical purine NTP pyrophosphatase [Vagococcus carniphilus]MDT2852879.1 non-canonical purine NTP pyrophosphatase [Vagococcus carniphilus]
MNIIVGTNNMGKLKEMQDSLSNKDIILIPYVNVYGESIEVEETKLSFKENAKEKAQSFSSSLNLPVLADDGGLILDAFPNLLGVKTARFFEKGLTDSEKNEKLLSLMTNETNRKLSLHAAICYQYPNGKTIIVEEKLDAMLNKEEKGDKGYGFDSIIYLPELDTTLGELPLEKRNEYSPRVRALNKITQLIKEEVTKNND